MIQKGYVIPAAESHLKVLQLLDEKGTMIPFKQLCQKRIAPEQGPRLCLIETSISGKVNCHSVD
jgi:hypothetical protein